MNSWTLVKIVEATQLAGHVVTLTLAAPDGQELPAFAPGAHIDVEPTPGLVRQYSLLGDPQDRRCYRIAIKLEAQSRGGSRAMHDLATKAASSSQLINVGAPRQNFPLAISGGHHVLLGAGIGITPLLSMARGLANGGASFALDYYAAAGQAAFADEIRRQFNSDRARVNEGVPRAGVEAALKAHLQADRPDVHYYACGPDGFMEMAKRLSNDHGAADRFHLERFAAEPVVGKPSDAPIRLVLARSGKEVTVRPDQTFADALAAQGVLCSLSCRQGICGTCITPVLEGTPDHRDTVLTPEEHASNSLICLCVSRAHGSHLVLDL